MDVMPDREKVIEALVKARTAGENYKLQSAEMSFQFIEMLIELLKEQENASKRNHVIVCPHCGKRVK
jgi:predicted class III extradiol MEMO1 family dioxygenase